MDVSQIKARLAEDERDHVWRGMSQGEVVWALDRIAKLEAAAEAARVERECHNPQCECPLCTSVDALDADEKETNDA